MPKKYLYVYIFDLLFVVSIIVLIGFSSPKLVGGGWVFCILSGALISLTIGKFRNLIHSSSLFATFIYIIALYNYLAQFEKENGFSILILLTSILLIIVGWYSLIAAICYPLKKKITESDNMSAEINLRKLIYKKFFGGGVLSIILFSISGIIFLAGLNKNHFSPLVTDHVVGLTTVLPIWFLVGLIYVYFDTRGIPPNYLTHLLTDNKKEDISILIDSIRNNIGRVLLISFTLGTFFELIRGNWAAYLLSFTVILFGTFLIYNTWKHFLDKTQAIDMTKVPNADNPKNMFKFFSISIIILMMSTFFMVYLFIMYR